MADLDYRKLANLKRRPAGLPETWSCRKCGVGFRPIRFNNIYCSKRCRASVGLAAYRARWGHDGPSDFVPGTPMKCANCGVDFVQTVKGKRTCSRPCAVAAGTARWRAKNPDFDAKRNDAVRRETLSHYSKGQLACVCCGESEMKFRRFDRLHVQHGTRPGLTA